MNSHILNLMVASLFFSIGISFSQEKQPSHYTHPIKCISHQGEKLSAPSHSQASYRLAMERKADVMKLDVRFSKDGIAVLSHDGDLKNCFGWEVKIAEKSLEELRERNFKPVGKYDHEKLQTLEEALTITRDCPEFWIDTKTFPKNTLERILAMFDKFGIAHSRLMLATGNERALLYAREHFPELRRVKHIYPQFIDKEKPLEYLMEQKEKFQLFGMNLPAKGFEEGLLNEEILQKLRAAGVWCSIWFVQSSEAAKRFSSIGADAFVTDNIRACRPFCRTPKPEK